mgnify:CR=1 FL=1
MKFLIKMTPIKWVIAIILVYYIFIKENEEHTFYPEVPLPDGEPEDNDAMSRTMREDPLIENPNGMPVGKAKGCKRTKCKNVVSRGVLGIGRKVEKGWCKLGKDDKCYCLGMRCGQRRSVLDVF